MIRYYRLEGQTPVACDLSTMGRGYGERSIQRVGEDRVENLRVSTVFLPVDHQFRPGGPPLVFETMVFDEASASTGVDLFCDRYSTWEEAAAGHARVVAWLQAGKPIDDLPTSGVGRRRRREPTREETQSE